MYPVDKNLPFYYCLAYFRLLFYYPSNRNYNKRTFLTISSFWMAFFAVHTLNIYTKFITSVTKNDDTDINETLADLMGNTSCILNCCFFVFFHKQWSNLFEALTDHSTFGKPPKYETSIQANKLFSRFCVWYGNIGVGIYTIISLIDEKSCEMENEELNLNRMCGMLSPTWWPNTIQPTLPIKRFYLIYQILATSWILPPTLTLCFIIYEAGGLIDVRIDHLKEVYDNIFETDNEEEQFKRFKLWVRYHQDIIGLCEQLNRISKRTIGHVLLIAAIVMGCIGNQLIKDSTPRAAIYLGGYALSVFFICHCGQQMINKTLGIRDTIYEGKWYMCDEKVKSWMPFVLLRCQKPMSLDALPLGSANYPLFLLIIKTTYSYITLLNQVV